MTTETHKRLLPSDISIIKRLRLRIIEKSGRKILAFAFFFSVFMVSSFNFHSYEENIHATNFVVQGTIPVPVLEMQPVHRATNLVAVLVHVSAASKEFLPRLGIDVTHAGIVSYLFDLPGYGESAVPTTDDEFSQKNRQRDLQALKEVINFIQKAPGSEKHVPMLLIGYALGATIVDDYLLANPAEHDLVSSVLLFPLSLQIVRGESTGNMLLVTGQFDFSATIDNTFFRYYCKRSIRVNTSTTECETPDTHLRVREVVLPFFNSILPLTASTSQSVLDWIHIAFPQIGTNTSQPILKLLQKVSPQIQDPYFLLDPYMVWLGIGLVTLYLSLSPLCYVLTVLLSIHSLPTSFTKKNGIFITLYTALSIPLAIALNVLFRPFRFLHVGLAEDVMGDFFLVAIIATLLMWSTRRTLPLPRFRQMARQMFAGICLLLFLYLTLRWLALFPWSPFNFTLAELKRDTVLFLFIWLTLLFFASIMRNNPEREGEFTASYFLKKITILLLVITIVKSSVDILILFAIWPFLLIFFLFSEICSFFIYKYGRASITASITSAFIMLICILMFFPFVQ